MEIGKLSTRLTLQQPSSSQDTLGQPLATWSDVATLWCDVRHASGLQSIKADADTSTAKASIRIRHRPGVTAAMRLVEQGTGTVYKINAVLPDARKSFVDLVCEVVT